MHVICGRGVEQAGRPVLSNMSHTMDSGPGLSSPFKIIKISRTMLPCWQNSNGPGGGVINWKCVLWDAPVRTSCRWQILVGNGLGE